MDAAPGRKSPDVTGFAVPRGARRRRGAITSAGPRAARKPGSVVESGEPRPTTTMSLGPPLLTASNALPGGPSGAGRVIPPYSGFLPVRFTKPTRSPAPLVRSYRTVSPLPGRPGPPPRERRSVMSWRSVLCCTGSGLAAGGRYPPPCPVEPGLSSPAYGEPHAAATAWPTPQRKCSATALNRWLNRPRRSVPAAVPHWCPGPPTRFRKAGLAAACR